MTKLTREELKALIQKAEAHRLTISHLQDELDALTLRIERAEPHVPKTSPKSKR